jgi:hypothetical protein
MPRAILYVPGLCQELFGQSASLVADRIGRALQAQLGPQEPFECERQSSVVALEEYPDFQLDIVKLNISRGGNSQTLLDIVEVKYISQLVKPLVEASPAARAYEGLRIARSSSLNYLRAIFARNRASKLNDVAQGFLLTVGLISGAAIIFWLLIGLQPILAINELLPWASGEWASKSLAVCSSIVSILAFSGFARKDAVNTTDQTAIEYISAEKYYRDSKSSTLNDALLSAIDWCKMRKYDKIDLLGLSFGAVVAIDTLFPRKSMMGSLDLRLNNLRTIGYPHDLIESVHRGYFLDRQAKLIDLSGKWINVYIEGDFLASRIEGVGVSFSDTDKILKTRIPDINASFEPDRKPVPPSMLDFFLPGRRRNNHCLYWDSDNPRARTCFIDVIEQAGWTDELRKILFNLSTARYST